jgi:segregation and condensation protein A
MSQRTFNIIVGEFTGSLEALLELVQKRKMHISEVSLSQVAEDYIAYVRSLEDVPSGELASFIVVATTLLLIKSKSLLPNLDLSEEEEDSIKDLEERLEFYAIYKQATEVLTRHVRETMPLAASRGRHVEYSVFAPSKNITLETLTTSMQEVLAQLPEVDALPAAAVPEKISIELVMEDLLHRVQQSVQQSFSQVAGQEREEVLTSFLALLELVKDGVLLAQQGDQYGEIMITK